MVQYPEGRNQRQNAALLRQTAREPSRMNDLMDHSAINERPDQHREDPENTGVLTQCWVYVGPASQTLGLHKSNTASTSRICSRKDTFTLAPSHVPENTRRCPNVVLTLGHCRRRLTNLNTSGQHLVSTVPALQ